METLCGKILNNLSDLQYTNNRGIKAASDTPLYVINKNSIPAGNWFFEDSEDAAYMTDIEDQANLALAIADGIIGSI